MLVLLLLTFLSIITYPIPSIRIVGQPIAIFLAVYVVLYFFYLKGYRRISPNTLWPLEVFLVGFIVSSLVSGTFNIVYAVNLLAFYLIFFVYANIGRTVAEKYNPDAIVHCCFSMLVLSGVLLCAYGFYGYITGKVGDEASHFWWSSAKYWGIHYTASTRNADVHYVAFPFIALLAIEKKSILQWLSFIAMGAALLLSMARNCWISILVVLIVRISLEKSIKKTFKAITLGLCAVIVSALLLKYFGMTDFFVKKILSIFDNNVSVSNSNVQRLDTILVTLETICMHPFGVGAEQMHRYYHAAGIYLNHAENTYINLAAELGIISAVGYVFLLYKPMKEVIHLYISGNEITETKRYVLLSFVYLAITLLFNTETVNCYIWIILGINWFLLNVQNDVVGIQYSKQKRCG